MSTHKNLGHLTLSVGYTDPLMGVTTWPLTTVAWTVAPAVKGTGADLEVHLSLQPGGLISGSEEAGDAAATRAGDFAARFAALWYQIQQPDVTMALSTSLQQSGQTPDALAVAMDAPRTFVTDAYRFARNAASLEAAYANPAVTADVNAVVSHYGISWHALGLAAGDRLLSNLLQLPEAGIEIPCYVLVSDGSSPRSLLGPKADLDTILQDADNVNLPLQVGTELVIPAVTKASPKNGLPLTAVAEAFGLSPASLVRANQAVADLLQPGFVFAAQGVEVEVPPPDGQPGPTLEEIAETFAQNGVPYNAVMAAGANAEKPGMFADGVTLIVDRCFVRDGWTLAHNQSGASTDALINTNKNTVDLFPAGTPLWTQNVSPSRTELAGETLGGVARANGIEAGDLLRHNGTLAPPSPDSAKGVGLPVAGLSALAAALIADPPAQLPSGGSGTTPAALVDLFKQDPTALLAANQATPNLIVAGVSLKPNRLQSQPSVLTSAADSVNNIIARFAEAGVAVTVADLVQGNLETAFLAPAAVLLLPPAETVLRATFGTNGWQFAGTLFPLRTWVTLARNPNLVEPEFQDGDVASVSSVVAVQRDSNPAGEEDDAETLDTFTAALAKAIPNLVPATGQVYAARDEGGPSDLFAVSFVAGAGISNVAVSPPAPAVGAYGPQPYSFALRPLYNSVQSASGVAVAALDPQTGLLGTPQSHDYQGVNVADWAHAFLAGLDLLCTGAYVTAAYPVNAPALARLLLAKQGLADAVADGLSAILAEQNSGGAALNSLPWLAAREVLRQRLLGDLVRGFDGTAMIQWQVNVTAPSDVADARLSGPCTLNDDADDGDLVRLGNAKCALTATKEGTLTFPLNVSRPQTGGAVTLKPTYAVNEVEFHIKDVTDGYQSSDWLQFVGNFAAKPPSTYKADLGTPQIPIPSRSYPAQPALAYQEALTHPNPSSLEEVLYWDYRVAVSFDGPLQDHLLIAVECNRGGAEGKQDRTETQQQDNLFANLAQYAAIEDTLWHLLDDLKKPDHDNTPALAAALQTYADLAKQVTKSWGAHWRVAKGGDDAGARPADVGRIHPNRRNPISVAGKTVQHIINTYAAVLASNDANGFLETLTLTQLDEDNTLGWPEIAVALDDGRVVSLTADDPKDAVRVYRFPNKAKVPVTVSRRFRLTFPKLHIAEIQNVTTAVSVQRNAYLLGEDGPRTCSSLMVRTPESSFPESLVPLIVVSEPMVMKPWQGNTGHHAFKAMLDDLFNGNALGRDISFDIRYSYTLAEGDPPLKTYVPVALYPRTTTTDKTVDTVVNEIKSWKAKVKPIEAGAAWSFNLSFYATADPNLQRPLLQIKQLVFPETGPSN